MFMVAVRKDYPTQHFRVGMPTILLQRFIHPLENRLLLSMRSISIPIHTTLGAA